MNKDIFVQVPKNQFANNVLDKFQAVGLFSIGFLFIHFSLSSDSHEFTFKSCLLNKGVKQVFTY